MSRMYGADADELDRLAAELDGYSDELGSLLQQGVGAVTLVGLSSVLNTIWRGPRAGEFAAIWQSRHLLRVREVQQLLQTASSDLRSNAQQQRSASLATGAAGGWLSFVGDMRTAIHTWLEPIVERRRWFDDVGHAELGRVRYSSPEEQLAWWQSLDPEQRRALLDYAPGELAFMDGLPQEVRAEARDAYIESISSTIPIGESTTTVGAKIEVNKIISASLGAEASVTTTDYADGSTVVTFELDADIAAGLGFADVAKVTGGVGGRVAASYRFDSPEAAAEFLAGLQHEILPHGAGDKALIATAGITGLIMGPWGGVTSATTAAVADGIADGKAYLDRFGHRRESLEAEVSLTRAAELGIDHNRIAAHQEAGLVHDFEKGRTSAYLELNNSLNLHDGVAHGMQAGNSFRGEVIFEGSELVGFKISGDVGAAGGQMLASLDGGSHAKMFHGVSAGFEASVDVTDPVTRAAVESYLRGDGTSLLEVLNRAEVIASVDNELIGEAEVGAKSKAVNVSGGIGHTESSRTMTLVKPPGGEFIPFPREVQ